jgi:hypothetical protein
MSANSESPKSSLLKRLNERLRAYDLSFSDALNAALFLLTILSLCLACVGVFLAWVTIKEGRKAGDNQDKQFKEQMIQLTSSASALGTAKTLLEEQSNILSHLQGNTAMQLEEERALLKNTEKQRQIAESTYNARPEPDIKLRCQAVNERSVFAVDIRKSNDKAADVSVKTGPLQDDFLSLVSCGILITNQGTQELKNAEILISNTSPLFERDGNADNPSTYRVARGVVHLYRSNGQKAVGENAIYKIGDVPETSKTETPCEKCEGGFILHVSREATFTTLDIIFTSENAARITYSLRMIFNREPEPDFVPWPSHTLSAEVDPVFQEDKPFDPTSHKDGVTVMDTGDTIRTIRLYSQDGADLLGYAELEIKGKILLGREGLLAYTNTFQRMRLLNGDGIWIDIARKAIKDGRLFIEVNGLSVAYTIYNIEAPSCSANSNGETVLCGVSDDLKAVIEPGIRKP